MRQLLFLSLAFFLQLFACAQRVTRRPHTPATINQSDALGRYFTVTLSNNDTIPVLLKLGPKKQIENDDTLNLSRTYPCGNPSAGEYYDLHDLESWENSCVSWYTLQLIKPKETIRFVVKLIDFDKSDINRLYFCYTKEINAIDREYGLYEHKKAIHLQQTERNFQTSYILINRNTSDISVEIGWK